MTTGCARLAFRPSRQAQLATIGRSRAVIAFGRFRVSGFPAWVLWSVAHVYFLVGFRNRAVVLIEWAWAYLTFQRGARLITDDYTAHGRAHPAVVEAPVCAPAADQKDKQSA